MNKNLQKSLLISTLLVIVLYSAGSLLGLFKGLSWYDEIVHFIAGGWGGIILIWIYVKYENKVPFYEKFKKSPLITITLLMVLVGVGWELFELGFVEYVKTTYNHRLGLQPSHFDTFTDLVLDGLGGWLAAYKFKEKSL